MTTVLYHKEIKMTNTNTNTALVNRTTTQVATEIVSIHTHNNTKINLAQLVEDISSTELLAELEGVAFTTEAREITTIRYIRTPAQNALGNLFSRNGDTVMVSQHNVQSVLNDPEFTEAVDMIRAKREAKKYGVSLKTYLAIKGGN